jgi:2-dehydro-3-deoxygluconokinase
MDIAPATSGPVVCFGEILLRLSAPDGEALLQSPPLRADVGGAEANVAVNLARLGDASRMVSAIADNALGRAALGELRRWGVETDRVGLGGGRMGLYFLTPGAGHRPGAVIYDRADSAFVRTDPKTWDWDAALAGAGLLHVSGVTPALGASGSAAAQAAVQAAGAQGVPVSFDGNYRATLWAGREAEAPPILRQLLAGADLAFVNDRDIALVLGRTFDHADADARLAAAAEAAFAAFPRLSAIATTLRAPMASGHAAVAGRLIARGKPLAASRPYSLEGAIDRIGAGDAFAAGLIFAVRRGDAAEDAVDFAAAAACAKHTIRGDFNTASLEDIEAIRAGEPHAVRR